MDTNVGTQSWKLTQVGVVVEDMEKAIARFEELGIGPFEPRTLPPGEEWYRGKPHHGDVKISMTNLGGVQLELVQPVSGESVHKEFLDAKGEGIQHLMFAVDDFDKTVATLTDKGAVELLRSRRAGGGGVVYLDLNASGVIIEIPRRRPETPR